MIGRLKEKWRKFRQGQPGRRFQERYERKRHANEKRSLYWKVLQVALALGLLLIGVVFVFIPGPAILFFAIGASMLATHSRRLARLLDWTEVKIREVWAWATGWWKRASTAARGAVVGLGTVGVAMLAYLAYVLAMPN